MAKRRGSITIDRNLWDWWGWSNPLYVRSWLDLLMTASWRDHTRDFQGVPVRVKRGQLVTSQRILADRWGCGRQVVRTFLRNLSDTDAISTQKLTHQFTIITITNYEDYQLQPNDQPTEKPTANPGPTHGQPRPNPQKNAGVSKGNAGNAPTAPGKRARKQRPPDLLWDALVVEELGLDSRQLTKSERGRCNTAVKQLRDAGATPEQIRERCAEFRRRYPKATLTATAVASNWGSLGAAPKDGENNPFQALSDQVYGKGGP